LKRLLNFGWLSVEEVTRLALSLAAMVLIARHLGPDRFGSFAYILGVVAMLVPLTIFGLEVIVMRQLVVRPEDRDRLLGTAIVIRLLGAAAGLVVAVGFVALAGGPEGATPWLVFIAALMLPFQALEAFNGHFKAAERMSWVAGPRIFVRIAAAAGALWLVVTGAGLSGFVALRTLEATMLGATAVAIYGSIAKGLPRLRFDPALARSMLREGTPLFLSAFGAMIYMRIDQVMLGQLCPADTLGQYSVAVRFYETVLFVPMAAQAAFYSGLVRAHAADPGRFRAELQHYYDVIALSMLGLAVVVAVGSAVLLVPMLGAAYAPAIPMVWVLVASLPFIGVGVARAAMLTIEGWLWTAPLAAALGLVTNVALNLVMIPAWGGIGAACATVASQALSAYGTCYLLPWLRPTGHEIGRALEPLGAARRILARWRAADSLPKQPQVQTW
jgi:O-antigen/teichoic acid export membrane protein